MYSCNFCSQKLTDNHKLWINFNSKSFRPYYSRATFLCLPSLLWFYTTNHIVHGCRACLPWIHTCITQSAIQSGCSYITRGCRLRSKWWVCKNKESEPSFLDYQHLSLPQRDDRQRGSEWQMLLEDEIQKETTAKKRLTDNRLIHSYS